MFSVTGLAQPNKCPSAVNQFVGNTDLWPPAPPCPCSSAESLSAPLPPQTVKYDPLGPGGLHAARRVHAGAHPLTGKTPAGHPPSSFFSAAALAARDRLRSTHWVYLQDKRRSRQMQELQAVLCVQPPPPLVCCPFGFPWPFPVLSNNKAARLCCGACLNEVRLALPQDQGTGIHEPQTSMRAWRSRRASEHFVTPPGAVYKMEANQGPDRNHEAAGLSDLIEAQHYLQVSGSPLSVDPWDGKGERWTS